MAELDVESPEALTEVDAQRLLDAQNKVSDEIGEGFRSLENFGVAVSAFYPVQGNAVVPKDPLVAIAEGASGGIPMMTGSNQDETTLWGYGDVSEETLARAAATYGAEALLKTYRHTRPHATPADLMIALTTDHMFRIPAVRLVEARLAADAASDNWMYWFCFITDLNPAWAPYTLDERSVMRYDDVSEVVLDPDGEERIAWAGVR